MNNNNIRINMRDSFVGRSFGVQLEPSHLVFCNCNRCSQMDSMRIYNHVMSNYIMDRLFTNMFLDSYEEDYINSLFSQSASELERNEKIKIEVSSKPYSDRKSTRLNSSH